MRKSGTYKSEAIAGLKEVLIGLLKQSKQKESSTFLKEIATKLNVLKFRTIRDQDFTDHAVWNAIDQLCPEIYTRRRFTKSKVQLPETIPNPTPVVEKIQNANIQENLPLPVVQIPPVQVPSAFNKEELIKMADANPQFVDDLRNLFNRYQNPGIAGFTVYQMAQYNYEWAQEMAPTTFDKRAIWDFKSRCDQRKGLSPKQEGAIVKTFIECNVAAWLKARKVS